MSASIITPVTLLTGALGSGKTTLLNHLLQAPGMAETAVLINEFGEIPIDQLLMPDLIRAASDNITVMNNGCICCSVAGDMVRALRDLYFKRSKGQIPHFKRVVIETTGLADPAPIMHTLIELPVVAARYVLSGVVTTIDATHAMGQLDNQIEVVKQAAVADRLVITKTDLVAPETLAALRARLTQLNPGATLIEASHGRVDVATLFDTGIYQPGAKTPDVSKWLNAEAYRAVPMPSNPMLARTSLARLDPTRHDERIQSLCLIYDTPVDMDKLVNVIEMIQAMRGDQLLRMKGIVNAIGSDKPQVLHAVQHALYPTATLEAWPDADHRTRLVFIVRELDPAFIRQTVDEFLFGPTTNRPASTPAPALVNS
jgi:G3E family GTPase